MTTTPRDEFFRRRIGTNVLYLTEVHHHVIDRIMLECDDAFTFDDVLQLLSADEYVRSTVTYNNTYSPDNVLRIAADNVISGRRRLIVIRSLEALLTVHMLSEDDGNRYHRCWVPNAT